ncbi:RHS repeat protein [Taylorella equigenitalis]|nr:RHS repeat protein [Taylorella equigenitalis]
MDGLDRETRYKYNPAGRIESRVDALNHEVGYRYDVLGRLSKLIVHKGQNLIKHTEMKMILKMMIIPHLVQLR